MVGKIMKSNPSPGVYLISSQPRFRRSQSPSSRVFLTLFERTKFDGTNYSTQIHFQLKGAATFWYSYILEPTFDIADQNAAYLERRNNITLDGLNGGRYFNAVMRGQCFLKSLTA
jgi:hypothetical protein